MLLKSQYEFLLTCIWFLSSPYTRVHRKGLTVANATLHGPSSLMWFCFGVPPPPALPPRVLFIYLVARGIWGNPRLTSENV